jgi:cytochrome P450
MRRRCPVAYSEFLGWSLFRHQDVVRVLLDHETFSNAVSRHLSVPNGMDPPEHTPYRRIIEPYFSAERMTAFEPVCRDIVVGLVRDLSVHGELEFVARTAMPFAEQVQCAFLGWPSSLHGRLATWTRKNHAATQARDRQAMSAIALEFEELIDHLIETRLRDDTHSKSDITAALMNEKVWGRPLSNEEVASILRNWTVGEIGTISASIGILVQFLAEHPELQRQLRCEPDLLPPAIEEILRIHGPLVSNRRVTTRPVEIGGKKIGEGERISVNWISANRDETVFDDPDSFRLDRDQSENLLYGAGIHICPGAPLARLELRVFLEEILAHTREITPVPGKPATPALYPAGGFSTLPLRFC